MGRGRGGCQTAGNGNPAMGQGRGGRGMGMGNGNGRGFGRGRRCQQGGDFWQEPMSRDEEIASLEKQISTAQKRLDALKLD
ncbi:MAG: DUF5320 family protein [Alphaproteobacteria bacterium]|nr:DUF5320 family protein [Alphaproteobacteria bacterium]